MARTRSKRGRNQEKTVRKSTLERRERDSKGKADYIVSQSSKDTVNHAETRFGIGEDTEMFVHEPRATKDHKGNATVDATETLAEQDVDDVDTRIGERDSTFPQFVIDTKPGFTINDEENDSDCDENERNDSDDEFPPHEINFLIDKVGTSPIFSHKHIAQEQDETDVLESEIETGELVDNSSSSKKKKEQKFSKKKESLPAEKKSLPSLDAPCEIDVGMDLGDCYINFDSEGAASSKMAVENVLFKSQQDELIKKSILTPDFEKKHSIPPYKVGIRQLKKQRKKERESSKGDGWFNMKAPEMTEELRNDIKVVRMRSTLDPKRFYKGNDMTAIPKFVQIGTVVDNPVDYYHSRVPKKQRKQTLVDELLADSDTRRYNKRKYLELQDRFNSFTKGGKKHKFGKKKVNGNKR